MDGSQRKNLRSVGFLKKNVLKRIIIGMLGLSSGMNFGVFIVLGNYFNLFIGIVILLSMLSATWDS